VKGLPLGFGGLFALILLASLSSALFCLPTVPVFDHAIFLADLFNAEPRWWALHNEHRPLIPRFIFWLEAWVFGGEPLFPAMVALGALLALLQLARRNTPGPWLWAGVALALFRPFSLAEWLRPTNLQYPLSLLCCVYSLHRLGRGNWLTGFIWGVCGVLSSAEGWLVVPLVLVQATRRGAPLRMGFILLVSGLGLWAYLQGFQTVTLWPRSFSDLWGLLAYLARLWGQPWAVGWGLYASMALFLAVVGQMVWARAHRGGRLHGSFLADLGAIGLLGFVAVVVGRWSLDMVVPRYSLGPTLAFSVALLRFSPRFGVLALCLLSLAELGLLVPDALPTCTAIHVESERFWRGESGDPSAAHPGLDPHIARELREHLWSQGLYLPR
jgi:hypothetical protein